jgi:hypothetical protein
MHNGSVLVYFKEEQLDDGQPVPSIRAELDVIRSSGSTWLNNALMMGRLDEDEDDWTSAAIDEFMVPTGHDRRLLAPISLGGLSPPPLDINHDFPTVSSRSTARMLQDHAPGEMSMPPTRHSQQAHQPSPTHEIWFTAPSELRNPQAQRLHHVAIRNFLAILHSKPIVGADMFDMLNTLQSQIQVMYGLDLEERLVTPAERSAPIVTKYLSQYGVDDVRNDVRHALSLLAWAEQDCVRWRTGYLECFVHLTGAMTPQAEGTPEFKRLPIATRRNLGIAAKTLQLRVMEAEEKLAGFDLTDLWDSNVKLMHGPVYQSYQSFKQFLISHYGQIYGSWPPPSQGTWLTRRMILAMQNDLGCLYDYLVNRDVYWNPREERASRKWEMQHRRTDEFEADLPELGITDMLITYDAKAGYAHIPHPYPLLPRDVSGVAKEKVKKGFFSSLKKDKPKDVTRDAKAHLQVAIVFSDATNLERLDVDLNGKSFMDWTTQRLTHSGSTLVERFEQFELSTDLRTMTPREARLGRWVLLYGILQILSTLSVDVQGLKHTEGVRYFLCTDLKRCPDWVTDGQLSFFEPAQQRSWCWQRSWDPSSTQVSPIELDAAAPSPSYMAQQPRSRANIQARNSVYTQHSISPPPRSLPLSPADFDGATLVQDDIARIDEKIKALSTNAHTSRSPRHEFERRLENDKVMTSGLRSPRLNDMEMNYRQSPTEKAYRPTKSSSADRSQLTLARRSERERRERAVEAYTTRPLPPPRSPLRSPGLSDAGTDLAGYPFSGVDMGFPSPPNYASRTKDRGGNRLMGYEGERVGGQDRERSESQPPRYEERSMRREEDIGERSRWV